MIVRYSSVTGHIFRYPHPERQVCDLDRPLPVYTLFSFSAVTFAFHSFLKLASAPVPR